MGVAFSSIAKLNPPKLSKVFPRKRLFNSIDSGLGKNIIWLSGSAGAGKTTTVASYLENYKLPALWYQMDSGDADPASFFYYLGIGAKKHFKNKKVSLPILGPEYLAGLNGFSKNFFRELFDNLKKSCVLVIDNYQNCPADSLLHEALVQGFEEIPEERNVFIISRNDPPPAFARLRASDSFYMFNPNDLSLTLDECRNICEVRLGAENGKDNISDKHLTVAHEITQGWTAGVILMLDQIQDESLTESCNLTENELIFEYFAGEVFTRSPHEVQDFLLKTSLLPIITPDLAIKVTGQTSAKKLLTQLVRKNYFLIRHSTVKTAYEYHPLFREFLYEKAEESLGKYEVIELLRESAIMLFELGHIEASVDLFCKIEDWHSLAKVVTQHGHELTDAGRYSTVRSWLEQIPDHIFKASPWLQYWMGIAQQPFNLQISRKHLINAYEEFKKTDDTKGIFMAWIGVVDTYIFEWSNFKPLDRWIAEMDALLLGDIQFPSDEIEARVAASMFSALMYRQPDHKSMPEWEEKLRNALIDIKDPVVQVKLGYPLFFYYSVWTGDMPKASMLSDMLRPKSGKDMDPATYTLWHALDSIFLWKSGDPKNGLEVAKRGLELSDKADFHLWDTFLYSGCVYCCISLGNESATQKYLKLTAESLLPERLWDVAHYHYTIGRLYLHRGKTHESLEHCEAGLKVATTSGSPYAEALLRTTYAQALFNMKQKEKAVAVNNIVLDLAERIRAKNMLFNALISEAEFAFDMGSRQRGLKALKQCFKVGREQGLISHAYWWPSIMADLVVIALEENIETDFVKKLIHVQKLVPKEPPLHLDNWPWAVRINTLGNFGLLVNDEPVLLTGKAVKRPLELLKVIISLGGKQIDQNKIIEILWPDAEGDSATQSLHTTLHRLRKILGEQALQLHSGYLSLNERLVWIDYWYFDHIVPELRKRLHQINNAANRQVIEDMTKAVINLYDGNFLENDADQSWFLPRQQKLRSRFVALMTELGNYWVQQKNWDQAITCLQCGLEIDNVSEELYQAIMQTYQNADRRADAMAAYQACRKNLSDYLGVSPSQKTVELYKRINPDAR